MVPRAASLPVALKGISCVSDFSLVQWRQDKNKGVKNHARLICLAMAKLPSPDLALMEEVTQLPTSTKACLLIDLPQYQFVPFAKFAGSFLAKTTKVLTAHLIKSSSRIRLGNTFTKQSSVSTPGGTDLQQGTVSSPITHMVLEQDFCPQPTTKGHTLNFWIQNSLPDALGNYPSKF